MELLILIPIVIIKLIWDAAQCRKADAYAKMVVAANEAARKKKGVKR